MLNKHSVMGGIDSTSNIMTVYCSEPMWGIEARNAAIANAYYTVAINRVGTVSVYLYYIPTPMYLHYIHTLRTYTTYLHYILTLACLYSSYKCSLTTTAFRHGCSFFNITCL